MDTRPARSLDFSASPDRTVPRWRTCLMNLTKAALVAASVALPLTPAAQLPTQKILTVEVAQAIAQEAMMTCRAGGHRVTVTVVDHTNLLKAFLRDDGAMNATVEVGRMKTNYVMAFARP